LLTEASTKAGVAKLRRRHTLALRWDAAPIFVTGAQIIVDGGLLLGRAD
jgi:hypothetical protein